MNQSEGGLQRCVMAFQNPVGSHRRPSMPSALRAAGGCTTLDTAIVARRMILVLCAVVHTLSHRGTRSNVNVVATAGGVASAGTLPLHVLQPTLFFHFRAHLGNKTAIPWYYRLCVGGNLMDPRSAGPCCRLRIDSSCSRGPCVFLRLSAHPQPANFDQKLSVSLPPSIAAVARSPVCSTPSTPSDLSPSTYGTQTCSGTKNVSASCREQEP